MENKSSKWIKRCPLYAARAVADVWSGGVFECDCCGYYSRTATNYCPNCGSNMGINLSEELIFELRAQNGGKK